MQTMKTAVVLSELLFLTSAEASVGIEPGQLAASHSSPPELLSLRVVLPESPMLWGARSSQRVLVLGRYRDGLERDFHHGLLGAECRCRILRLRKWKQAGWWQCRTGRRFWEWK